MPVLMFHMIMPEGVYRVMSVCLELSTLGMQVARLSVILLVLLGDLDGLDVW